MRLHIDGGDVKAETRRGGRGEAKRGEARGEEVLSDREAIKELDAGSQRRVSHYSPSLPCAASHTPRLSDPLLALLWR